MVKRRTEQCRLAESGAQMPSLTNIADGVEHILTPECRRKIYAYLVADPTVKDAFQVGIGQVVELGNGLTFYLSLPDGERVHLLFKVAGKYHGLYLLRDDIERLLA